MRVDDHTERAQGFIELDVRSSRVPGTLDPAPRRQFGSLGHYRELTDPVTGRNFWFDVWTRETFWVHPGEVLKRERETLARNKKSQLRIQELQAKRKKKSWFASKQESDLRGDSEALLHGLDRLTANSLEPQMVLGMILIRAHNLRNTDGGMLSGKSDPYATIRFGSEVIGRTATVKDCLDPEWFEGIRGVLPLGDEATEVVIEVWDDDGGGGRDDLLGEARLTSAQLYANADKVATLQLAAKPGQPAAQGSIEVHFECKLKCVFEINSLRTQEARDVYCSASWEGRECGECGRTPTTNPEDGLALWGHRFAIAIPVRWPLDVLVLTVREHRTEGEDALLGSVRVDASTLLPISFKEGEKPPEAPILRFPLSFSNDLSVPVKKRDLNRKGLVKRGKNFRRPSWEQAEIESKRKRPSSSRSFDEQLELERYAEEDDLGDPASPIANHLSRVTYDEVKEEPVRMSASISIYSHTHIYHIHIYFNVARRPRSTTPPYAIDALLVCIHTYNIYISTGRRVVCGAVAHGRVAGPVAAIVRERARGALCGSFDIPVSQSALGWVILYKTVGEGPPEAVGRRREAPEVACYSKEDVREASYAYQVIF
jgi:hypothetical protein